MTRKSLLISIVLAIVIVTGSIYYFSSNKPSLIFNDKQFWDFALVDTVDFNAPISWNIIQEDTTLTINNEKTNQFLLFHTTLTITDIDNFNQALLTYENKYEIELYINNKLCYKANKNLITTETYLNGNQNPESLNIFPYWSTTKRFIEKSTLIPYLINGENKLVLVVTNTEKITDFNPSKISFNLLNDATLNLDLYYKKSGSFSKSPLPILIINTFDKEIPDDPKTKAVLNIINSDRKENKLNDDATEYAIKIERRGFTSQKLAKKSYTFSLKKKSELLQLPSAKKWVLYAPYADKSLIRNVLTYDIYRKMGHYSPKTQFVELVINNNYQGIYVLTDKINIGEHHLNIPKLTINENNTVSGGYLLEIDRNNWKSLYPPEGDTSAVPLSYEPYVPKKDKIPATIQELIKNQFNEFEKSIYTNNNKYHYLDLNSFVDYFIISEFTKNIDAYRLSTFIYNPDITAYPPKFYIDPIWDYNFAYGLTNYNNGFSPEGYVYTSTNYVPFWWKKLIADPIFKQQLTNRYQNLRKTALSNNTLNQTIDSIYQLCKTPAENNFKKWTVLNATDFWPNYYLGKTHQDEINYLKNWIEKRLVFLDEEILNKKTISIEEKPHQTPENFDVK